MVETIFSSQPDQKHEIRQGNQMNREKDGYGVTDLIGRKNNEHNRSHSQSHYKKF